MLTKSLLFTLALLLFTASGVSQDTHDNDPPPGGESSNQLSWQSAFWGLVGIALNTIFQPSGRILGLPSSWGPALKCSPIFCIANLLQGLNSIRIVQRDSDWILTVVPHKYDADEESDHTDVATLQRNTLFRIIAFILGPVLQGTKLYACRGIFWTQFLATIYIASFLCDEFTLCLLWLTGSTASRASVTGLAEALLSRSSSIPTSPTIASSGSSREGGTVVMNIGASFVWYPACFFLFWFAGDAVAGLHLEVKKAYDLGTPDLTDWMSFFTLCICAPFLSIVFGVVSYKRGRLRFWTILGFVSTGALVPIELAQLVTASATMADILDNGIVDFQANLTLARFAWKVFIICTMCSSWKIGSKRFGSYDGHGVPKTIVLTVVLWASAHLLTTLAMYKYAYDTSRTFQPSWTNVFG